jgi:hypothetical protein
LICGDAHTKKTDLASGLVEAAKAPRQGAGGDRKQAACRADAKKSLASTTRANIGRGNRVAALGA